ncbi:glucose-methanol-choline oxidoreductase [Mycena vulgaris]|nr:glucose-methanol-choline oxidoreductase [Mycena vulgaris]
MRPRDQFAVVDFRLNVHSVQGLKIADLSVAPSNVSTYTGAQHGALMIVEQAAIIIADELGIEDVRFS